MMMYGPKTTWQFRNHTDYCGAMAMKSVDVYNGTEITPNAGPGDLSVPAFEDHFLAKRFVECTVAGAPGVGC